MVAVFWRSVSIREVSMAFPCGLRSNAFVLRWLKREAPVKIDAAERRCLVEKVQTVG